MIEQMITAHSILVKVFLGFLVAGIAIPFMTAKNPVGFKKASFIYTMIFQALATMIAFAGIVAIYAGHTGWDTASIIMVVVWAALMFIEIKKYKLIKLSDLHNRNTHLLLKSAFFKISLIEIFLVVAMVVLMILKAKGIVTL